MTANPYLALFRDAETRYGIPWQYLASLSYGESRWCPTKIAGVKGCPDSPSDEQVAKHAVGLFQITRGVVKDYNSAHGVSFHKRDMLDAARNTDVAAWDLSRRIYPMFMIEWGSERQVAMFTQAWNSGPYAFVRVFRSLANPSVSTVDDIKLRAQQIYAAGQPFEDLPADKYKWLAMRNTKWAKRVALRYMKSLDSPDFFDVPPLANV